ncbi:MAG: hypothetical protein MN733_20190 [Nitrososphaera sp.]|nr:hypothetical protein [Nitrososphaera sp.]
MTTGKILTYREKARIFRLKELAAQLYTESERALDAGERQRLRSAADYVSDSAKWIEGG